MSVKDLWNAVDSLWSAIGKTDMDIIEKISNSDDMNRKELDKLRTSIRKTNLSIRKELKDLRETVELIERFLGDDYAKLKKEESQLPEKDE